jgi:hypothetical protein
VARTAEGLDHVAGKLDVMQHHVLVQRGVAEQHVEELPRIVPDGLGGERDADLEQSALQVGDGLNASGDLLEHEVVIDRGERHLDALLGGNGLGARVDRPRVTSDAIDGLQTRMHGHSERTAAGT